MVLIRCDQMAIDMATELFPCQVVSFLIRYLGVPLSVTKLPRSAWQTLLDKASDRLPTWKGNLMNMSGHLALIRSTLSVIPIYVSIEMGLPRWVHNAFIKLMKAFLWSGSCEVQGGKCLVAWHVVHHPQQLGGLGILDLKVFGRALRLWWMWLQRTDPDRAWMAMPIWEDSEVSAFFNASFTVSLGDAIRTLLWQDPWIQGQHVLNVALDLLVTVHHRRRRTRTVALATQS
jgi:hypothetical protein